MFCDIVNDSSVVSEPTLCFVKSPVLWMHGAPNLMPLGENPFQLLSKPFLLFVQGPFHMHLPHPVGD